MASVGLDKVKELYYASYLKKFIEFKYSKCSNYENAAFPMSAFSKMITFVMNNYDPEDVLWDVMEDALDDVLKDFDDKDFFVVNRGI